MLGSYVSKGASVLQLEGTTRELYYYPKNINQVTVVGEDVTPGTAYGLHIHTHTHTHTHKDASHVVLSTQYSTTPHLTTLRVPSLRASHRSV